MILAKAKERANRTFIVQASLITITYDHQNIFIAQGKGDNVIKLSNTVIDYYL
jgi:hypothetical protein